MLAYVHNIDPFAIQFPDFVPLIDGIRWYGLSYLSAFVVAGLFMWRITKVGRTTLKHYNISDFIVYLAIGVIAGGRLGYVLFYDISLLTDFSSRMPWWGVLALNRGGMASHGGIIGVILACFVFARRGSVLREDDDDDAPADRPPKRIKHSVLHVLDLAAIGTPVGFFFGRLANFINGELYGRECPPETSWAVQFPQELPNWNNDQRAGLTDAVSHLGIGRQEWSNALATMESDPASADLVHAAVYKLIEATHTSSDVSAAVTRSLESVLTPRYPSQLVQAGLEGLTLAIILAIIWLKPRRPGVVGASFIAGYGALRIVGEMFREPDAHIGFQMLGLTRGQWLSVIMPVAGIAIAVLCARRKVEPMGGLLNPLPEGEG